MCKLKFWMLVNAVTFMHLFTLWLQKRHPFYFSNNPFEPWLIWVIFTRDIPETAGNKMYVFYTTTTPVSSVHTLLCNLTVQLCQWTNNKQ